MKASFTLLNIALAGFAGLTAATPTPSPALDLAQGHAADAIPLADVHDLFKRGEAGAQDPFNVTDQAAYNALYKRAVGCDPVGCFDGAYFSFIVGPAAENRVKIYGSNNRFSEPVWNCPRDSTYQGFTSWLPYVLGLKMQYSVFGGCGSQPKTNTIEGKYASIGPIQLSRDTRCGNNGGGNSGRPRCIWAIRP